MSTDGTFSDPLHGPPPVPPPPPTLAPYYGFGGVPALSQPPIAYDIVLSKNYPRIAFVPTEPGGIYQEFVEVGGDWWFVTNATWDPNLQGFYQESGPLASCNPAQNAYAWCHRGITGDAIRFYAPATNDPTTPVVWNQVFDASPTTTIISPLPILGIEDPPALQVNTTFDAAVTEQLTAFALNVTNIASAANSALEQFTVNGQVVWLVDESGTLQIGKFNPSQLDPPIYLSFIAGTGIGPIGPPPVGTIALAHGDYVDLANAQTITGVKTIASGTPMIFGGKWGNIQGGPDDGIYMCSGAKITNFPPSLTAIAESGTAMILAGKQESNTPPQALSLYVDTGLTIGNTYSPTLVAYFDNQGNFLVMGDVTVGGDLSLTGGLSINGPLTVGGTLTLNGGLDLASSASVLGLRDALAPLTGGLPNTATHTQLGFGLEIGYNAALNEVIFDTHRLALIGPHKDAAPGIFSSDGTVDITKDPSTNQNVDLSVKAALAKQLPVWFNGNNLTTPLCISGSLSVGPMAGAGGFNGFPSATGTVSFPSGVSFANANYALTVSVGGDWWIVNVHSMTAGGFTVSVSATGSSPVANAFLRYIAIGESA